MRASSEIILSLILAEMLIASNIRPVLKWRVLDSFSVWRKEETNASYCIYNLQHKFFFQNLRFEFIFKIFILDILIKYNLIQSVYLRI